MKIDLSWIKNKKIIIFDKNQLSYKYINNFIVFLSSVAIISITSISGYLLGKSSMENESIKTCIENPEAIPIIINTSNSFSEKKLWDMLVGMNVRFPHIAIGQARHETGHYTSPICIHNHNYFGMKVSKSGRCTTNRGEARGHSLYDSWQESALDYAFLQTTYLRDLKTEDDYIYYIDNFYAAPGRGYGEKIRKESRDVLKLYAPHLLGN